MQILVGVILVKYSYPTPTRRNFVRDEKISLLLFLKNQQTLIRILDQDEDSVVDVELSFPEI
jgi:hypothetical protein